MDGTNRDLDLAPVLALALGLTLAEACERAEDRVVSRAVHAVQTSIVSADPRRARDVIPGRFAFDDTVYEIRIHEAAHDAALLYVYVGALGAHWQIADFRCESITVDGSGRYTSISVAVDPRLADVANCVVEALAQYFNGAYRRLQANVEQILLEADLRVAIRLYAELRSIFDEKVSAHISLYALVDDERAMYMLDPPAILKTLERSRHTRASTGGSPLVLTALLAMGWVKADETAAIRALSSDAPLAVRLADMHYTTSPLYNVAEEGLYGETAYVQPIVRDGHVKLIAAYPTALRSLVEPELGALRDRFAEIVRDYERSTKKLVGQLAGVLARGWDDYIAEFMGRILKGFFASEVDSDNAKRR